MFWGSIVTYQGGGFVTQMLIAIWPTYANLPNTLPASSGLTSQDFLSFVLFWAIQFPFILIHPTKLRWLFVAKISTIPIVAIGTMAWSIKQAGPEAVVVLTAKATGNYFGFFTAVTASMGVWITLACNISDFSRYSLVLFLLIDHMGTDGGMRVGRGRVQLLDNSSLFPFSGSSQLSLEASPRHVSSPHMVRPLLPFRSNFLTFFAMVQAKTSSSPSKSSPNGKELPSDEQLHSSVLQLGS